MACYTLIKQQPPPLHPASPQPLASYVQALVGLKQCVRRKAESQPLLKPVTRFALRSNTSSFPYLPAFGRGRAGTGRTEAAAGLPLP